MYRNLLLMLVLLNRSLSTKPPLPVIRNLNKPICANCIHYISDGNHPNSFVFAKCKLFGHMDVVTGSITYEYVSVPRRNDAKCGVNGTFYEEKGRHNQFLGTSTTRDL